MPSKETSKKRKRARYYSFSVASNTIIIEVPWSLNLIPDLLLSLLSSPRFGLPLNEEDNSNDSDIEIGLDEAFVYTA